MRQKGRPKKTKNHGQFGLLRTTQEPKNDDMHTVSNFVSTTKSTPNSPPLPSASELPLNNRSNKWDFFAETILSPRRRRKKKSKVSDRELKSMANQLFPTDRLKSDESSFWIEDNSGNRILPYRELKECLESNIVCKKCHSRLSERQLDGKLVTVTEKTVGIATELTCRCNCCDQIIFQTHQPKSSLENKITKRDSNESYQLNCLLVLGFQLLGGGCLSADIILSFLNLPHGSSMKSSKFHRIESKLAPKICKLGESSIESALKEEVYLQLKKEEREQDYVKWLNNVNVPPPMLTVSYNMGWQQRSSGQNMIPQVAMV